MVEIFCGKAGLSKKLRNKFFQVVSVDHVAAKGIPILKIDIEKASERTVLEELLQLDKILYVHFAPPCGTASLARCIPLKNRDGPKPLRSMRHPMGLPKLPLVSRERVSKANRLYYLTGHYIKMLDQMQVGWSVENPSSSLMWITTPFIELMKCFGQNAWVSVFTTACLVRGARK